MALSPNTLESKSSLEELLENLRLRSEEKPKDLPPSLPSRPRSTSSRPPSIKRLLSIGEYVSGNSGNVNKGKVKKTRRNSFGGVKVKDDQTESPYEMALESSESELRVEGSDGAELANSSSVNVSKSSTNEVDDNVGYFFRKKLRVWCQLGNGKYISGQIQSTSGDKASVLLSDGRVVTVFTGDLSPANPDILEGVDDLIQLSYLNEPSVLHNLQHRYSRDMIYSRAGHVLIAINPFKDVQLYGNEFITAYKQKLVDSPHIYFIADAAYTEMMSDDLNQSIIISGESGSGKTETAKIAMQYLAGLAGGSNGIESDILHTNCILEAFGNAKTFRNDNSSRFGRIIEIHFSVSGKICGAKLQTFLLEKSRVVQLAQGERSYHIFYQICAGAPTNLRDKLKLRKANDYYYLNQSNCLTIQDVDDANRFHKLMAALNSLKISIDDQEHAYEMLAAILWLGNIYFEVINNENHIGVLDDEAISIAASLLGCSSQDLILALTTHKIQAGKEKVAKRLTLQQAIDARDALAKCLYASLFNWLVEEINKSFAVGKTHTGRSISVLDIYGFESHKENSFEQLCINYANERLQQHFNRHLFKLEQEEYELDGIDWTKVDFVDNQECLDLFEKKPIGLISLLDEESKFPRATDLTFANKIKQYLDANPCFKGVKNGTFCVLHSAGEVLYDTSGFLEKNRDSLHSDTIQLLSLCKGRLPQAFAANLLNQPLKQSVGTKFKGQLFKLMQQLETTKPHFIRCIKPNNQHIPGLYEDSLVLEQLRWCGVLEVVRIVRSGYPTRLTHQEFTRRYGFLLPDDGACQDPLTTSVSILQQFNILPEMYQVGYTKLYFRVGQIGHLQELRKQLLQGTLEVQKCYRAHRARSYFHELRGGVTELQSFIRGEIDRRQCKVLLNLKEKDDCKKLDEQLRAVIQIQSALRGSLARKHSDRLRSSRRFVRDIQITKKISEVKDLPPEMLPSIIEELQRRIVMAEDTCSEKEKENAALREQVQQFEARWSAYETKMKTMEDIWLKQMSSLQANLAAAKKSLAADASTGQPGTADGRSRSPCHNDSDDSMSLGTTPEGCTPSLYGYNGGLDVRASGEINDANGGSQLAKEFEERKKTFDDAALAIVKSGQSISANPIDEFRQLKHQFEAWKKDYKIRLKEARSKLPKHGNQEGEKVTRKWWGKRTKKLLLHSVQ